MLLEDGNPIEFTEHGAFRREPVPVGRVCVDSGSLEEIEEFVIRDRRHLSEDGVVVPIVAMDKHNGRLGSQPEIVTRGFLPSDDDDQGVIAGAREVVLKTIQNSNAEEKIRLDRNERKNPRGLEALFEQANFQAPVDSARHPGSLGRTVSVKFTLRPYDSSDFDALYTLDRACYPPGIAYSRSMLRWFLKQPGAVCIVAQGADAQITAFILAEADHTARPYHHARRGRRMPALRPRNEIDSGS